MTRCESAPVFYYSLKSLGTRVVYSRRSGCLVLPKNSMFYEKSTKNCYKFGPKGAKILWRSSQKLSQDLVSACLKTPTTTFCLTILVDLKFLNFFVLNLSSLTSFLINSEEMHAIDNKI